MIFMKGYHSIMIFLVLVTSSVWASYDSYRQTESRISGDLTHALAMTIQEKRGSDWLSPDTIVSFRSHLQLSEIKEKACLSLHVTNEDLHPKQFVGAIAGDTLHVSECLYANGYVACSALAVWSMSDHRLSQILSSLSLMWLLAMCYRRERILGLSVHYGKRVIGNAVCPLQASGNEPFLFFSEEEKRFYNARHVPIHFTPMQEQLMLMFLNAPRHELTKQEICAALWPKKDDPSETLYTLIRRIKPILEANHVKIESERGRSYRISFLSI